MRPGRTPRRAACVCAPHTCACARAPDPKVDDNGEIVDSCFKTFGCGSAIASSSVASEWIKGKSMEDASGIKNSDIAAELKLPPVKLHCSMLAEDAIKAAIEDVKQKKAAAAAE